MGSGNHGRSKKHLEDKVTLKEWGMIRLLVNYLSLLFKSYLSLNRIVCHVSHCLSGISV